ncbi:MAG: hypothetical protein ACFFEN_12185 [Candidatus Thorarchaeota archaeon]
MQKEKRRTNKIPAKVIKSGRELNSTEFNRGRILVMPEVGPKLS